MSAGNFIRSKYETSLENGGGIYPIRIQPETAQLTIAGQANAAPAGNIDQLVTAKANKSNGAYGVGARAVTLAFTGAPPDGYSGENVRVAVLTPDAFAAYTVGATGTYLGAAVEVVSRLPESVR